jgi:hypothetical protein
MTMAKYKLKDGGVIDTETGAHIPNAEDNRHWRFYQEWLAEGNTPDPADPPPPEPTPGEVFDQRIEGDPVLKALVDELEASAPGYRGRARSRM